MQEGTAASPSSGKGVPSKSPLLRLVHSGWVSFPFLSFSPLFCNRESLKTNTLKGLSRNYLPQAPQGA